MALPAAGCYLSNPTLFLPSDSFLPILLFLILFIFLPTSECRRRGVAGRLRCRLGSGGAATIPGTALGPGGCHPRGRPGLSRAPARTPHYPNVPPTRPGGPGMLEQPGYLRAWGVTEWAEPGGARERKSFGGGGVHRRFIPGSPRRSVCGHSWWTFGVPGVGYPHPEWPGIGADTPLEVAGCDAGKANIGIPGFWLVSGGSSCVRTQRGERLACLLESRWDNRSARESLCVGIHRVWISISRSAAKRAVFGGGLRPDPTPSGGIVFRNPSRVDVNVM